MLGRGYAAFWIWTSENSNTRHSSLRGGRATRAMDHCCENSLGGGSILMASGWASKGHGTLRRISLQPMCRRPPGGIMCMVHSPGKRKARWQGGGSSCGGRRTKEQSPGPLVVGGGVAQGQRGRHGRVHGSQLRRSSQPSWATTWPRGHEAGAHLLPLGFSRTRGHHR